MAKLSVFAAINLIVSRFSCSANKLTSLPFKTQIKVGRFTRVLLRKFYDFHSNLTAMQLDGCAENGLVDLIVFTSTCT